MSERYNVAASAVLGDNYKITNIVCSDYNPNIDSTITVTVSVDDVYGDAVSGESVTVTVSEGNFTQLNGSNITSASSVTGTTNSSGQFTLTYACSEWGLATFSANTSSTHILVEGWKQVWSAESNKIVAYTDGTHGRLIIDGLVRSTVPISFGNYGTGTPLSGIAPLKSIFCLISNAEIITMIASNGKIYFKSNTGVAQSNVTVHGQVEWGI